MLGAVACLPVPQARFSPNAGPLAPKRASRAAKAPCVEDVVAQQRRRVGARRPDERRVDAERPQVVRGPHVVDRGEQGALASAQRRSPRPPARARRRARKSTHRAMPNMLGDTIEGRIRRSGCRHGSASHSPIEGSKPLHEGCSAGRLGEQDRGQHDRSRRPAAQCRTTRRARGRRRRSPRPARASRRSRPASPRCGGARQPRAGTSPSSRRRRRTAAAARRAARAVEVPEQRDAVVEPLGREAPERLHERPEERGEEKAVAGERGRVPPPDRVLGHQHVDGVGDRGGRARRRRRARPARARSTTSTTSESPTSGEHEREPDPPADRLLEDGPGPDRDQDRREVLEQERDPDRQPVDRDEVEPLHERDARDAEDDEVGQLAPA